MRRFLEQLAVKLQTFMMGRYGTDRFNKALITTSFVLFILSFFIELLYPLALALMVYAVFRTFSKNIYSRRKECDAYDRFINSVRTKCRLYKRMWKERRTHRYFKCKQCKAVIRIPKGRGTVDVGCPRCHTRTTQKS